MNQQQTRPGTRPVTFDSDGCRLFGVLGAPEGEANGQGVVLVHGWSGYRIGPHRILVRTARRLNAAGYATLHFDLRGRGDSEGDYDDVDLDMMIADARHAVAFLREQGDCESVSLLGICSGANVALGAATLDTTIRHVIAWSALPFQKQASTRQHTARRRSKPALSNPRLIPPAPAKRSIKPGISFLRLVPFLVYLQNPAIMHS